jgi:Arm DNA-binding domain
MALSDTAIRNAKHGDKPIKLFDERGLFLLLQPSGGKLWRLKYRYLGKEKKLSLGIYPDVQLKEARRRRDEARTVLANGFDPALVKADQNAQAKEDAANSFSVVGHEYIDKTEREGRADITLKKSRWLLSLMEPALGHRPVSANTPAEMLACLQKVEARGHLETASRMRSVASQIFRYAVAASRATTDPSSLLRGALPWPRQRFAIAARCWNQPPWANCCAPSIPMWAAH